MSLCSIDGCTRTTRSPTSEWCNTHYFRHYRYGTTDLTMKPAKRRIHSGGYVLIPANKHPIANGESLAYEHRVVYYDAHGTGPFSCHWCGKKIIWKTLHIDHVDNVKTNNSIDNLVASCPICNQKRGFEKARGTWRKKVGISFQGETLTLQEWANRIGVSVESMRMRVKKMSLEDALTKPRGKSGPKGKKDKVVKTYRTKSPTN